MPGDERNRCREGRSSPCAQIGIVPYAGVDIACFEIMKEHLVEAHDGRPPPAAIFGAGMLSSCFAQFVSYPLALVRTRLQVKPDLPLHDATNTHCTL